MTSDLPDNLPHSLSIQEPRVADTPFNNKAADVILRTSDKVDFYVYKVILSLASPVFESMFSLPQPASASDPSLEDGSTASHPVIDVSEDSRTMDSVLHFCYPVRRPSMTKLVDVGPVLFAAFKYEMNVVLAVARIALEQCIDQDKLGAFALALRCELYDVCSKAAKQFAQHPFLSLDSKELDHIKADRYRQLLKYHDSFARDSDFVVLPEAWSNSLSSEGQPSITSPASSVTPPSSSLVLSPDLPREADTPFDDKTADVILCSSDRVHFYVHSFILSLASPAFKDIIHNHLQTLTAEAHSAGGEEKLSPIIDVTEDSRTLGFVLGVCYPVHLPRLTKMSEARVIFAAGLKYGINAVKSLVEATLADLIDQDILGVWSIALRYKLRDLCTLAARHALQHPWASLNSEELSCISARQYHELLQYHKRCSKAASTVVSSRTWFSTMPGGPSKAQRCSNCDRPDPVHGSDWLAPPSLWNYLATAKRALEARPCGLTVLSSEVLSQWTVSFCTPNGNRKEGRKEVYQDPQGFGYYAGSVFGHNAGSAYGRNGGNGYGRNGGSDYDRNGRSDYDRNGESDYGCTQIYTRDHKFAQALAKEVDRVVAEVDVPDFF